MYFASIYRRLFGQILGLPHGFVQKVANFFKNVAKTLHFFSKTWQKRGKNVVFFLYGIKNFL